MNFKYGDHTSPVQGNPEDAERAERKLKLKSILDKWNSCELTLSDAETQLTELLATQAVHGQFEATVGTLKINSPSGMPYDVTGELNGIPLAPFRKMVITIEAGHHIRFMLEGSVGYVPQPKKE